MGRIFFSRLIGTFLGVFIMQTGFAQNRYYVFKKAGSPFFKTGSEVERGASFQDGDTLQLGNEDYVMLVNQKGELFEIKVANKYTFNEVLNYRLKMEYTSFTKKYFTYVWSQFTNKRKSKQEAGVVYREDRNVQGIMPMDSALVYKPNVWFRWKNKTNNELVYFFLKDLEKNHITKIGTPSDSLLLHIDNYLLSPGKNYQWSVASSSFPNLNDLKFYSLKVLIDDEYAKIEQEIAILIKTFKLLGFSEKEIQKVICIDYKFCYF